MGTIFMPAPPLVANSSRKPVIPTVRTDGGQLDSGFR